MTDGKIRLAQKFLKNGMLRREVADDLGISLTIVCRWIPAAASESCQAANS